MSHAIECDRMAANNLQTNACKNAINKHNTQKILQKTSTVSKTEITVFFFTFYIFNLYTFRFVVIFS